MPGESPHARHPPEPRAEREMARPIHLDEIGSVAERTRTPSNELAHLLPACGFHHRCFHLEKWAGSSEGLLSLSDLEVTDQCWKGDSWLPCVCLQANSRRRRVVCLAFFPRLRRAPLLLTRFGTSPRVSRPPSESQL